MRVGGCVLAGLLSTGCGIAAVKLARQGLGFRRMVRAPVALYEWGIS
jgi:hypothetical protein